MLKVALTGGIGCGKSTVTELFQRYAVPIIDADQEARAVVAIGEPGLAEVQAIFGAGVLAADGSLNRRILSDIIFADEQQRQVLEGILHPLIYARIQAALAALALQANPYCIIAIPLLFESHGCDFIDRILVVDCSETLQIQRIKIRDQFDDAKIAAIMNSQVSRQYRCTHADEIIDNSLSLEQLAAQVEKLHNLYLSFSKAGYSPLS